MSLPKDIVSESIRYWEPRRIIYNLILFGTVLVIGATRFFYPYLFAPPFLRPLPL